MSTPNPLATETPADTYERVTGMPWPGGMDPAVTVLLRLFRITEKPGSLEANLQLQRVLNLVQLIFTVTVTE